jgi:hypothetical protein
MNEMLNYIYEQNKSNTKEIKGDILSNAILMILLFILLLIPIFQTTDDVIEIKKEIKELRIIIQEKNLKEKL